MTALSPIGARILTANRKGLVSGHAAAIARLLTARLIRTQGATYKMTTAGHEALAQWLDEQGQAPPDTPWGQILPKLPGKQHEALLTAARRADQLVAGRDDRAYWRGEPWFNERTLAKVHGAGYADIRPQPWDPGPVTWEQTGRSLFLTPAGREYARQHGSVAAGRRRVVLIACGQKKAEPDYEKFGYRGVIPAGRLYIGSYHRSLRRAADALTDQSLIRIVSALYGLVTLNQPLPPYDVTLGDERAITAAKLAGHTAALGLDDAEVIFLGGQAYAELLRPSVPHLSTPLVGDMFAHRSQCKEARESVAIRARWWQDAARPFERHHPQAP